MIRRTLPAAIAVGLTVLALLAMTVLTAGQESEIAPIDGRIEMETRTVLQDALNLTSFDAPVPRDVTFGFQFSHAVYTPPIYNGRGGHPIDDMLTLNYVNEFTRVQLIQARHQLIVGGPTEEIEVAGVTGELVRGEHYGYPGTIYISWTKGDMSFSARTTLNENFSLDDFLRYLRSIS